MSLKPQSLGNWICFCGGHPMCWAHKRELISLNGPETEVRSSQLTQWRECLPPFHLRTEDAVCETLCSLELWMINEVQKLYNPQDVGQFFPYALFYHHLQEGEFFVHGEQIWETSCNYFYKIITMVNIMVI
jgi:hypothetical protein